MYRQAVKLRPSWAEGWWFLGELLYDQNQYPEARDSLRRLIDLDRTTGPGFALLGLCEFETKEYDKALNHIYQARRLGLGDRLADSVGHQKHGIELEWEIKRVGVA